jgi:hypothetical protein
MARRPAPADLVKVVQQRLESVVSWQHGAEMDALDHLLNEQVQATCSVPAAGWLVGRAAGPGWGVLTVASHIDSGGGASLGGLSGGRIRSGNGGGRVGYSDSGWLASGRAGNGSNALLWVCVRSQLGDAIAEDMAAAFLTALSES